MIPLVASALLLSTGCAAQRDRGFKMETVASNLSVPWALAFAPDGRIFFTERDGNIRVIDKAGNLWSDPVLRIEKVSSRGETGMTGIALHPDFEENHWIYVAYAYRPNASVRIERFTESEGKLSGPRTIIENIPGASIHAGTALSFGPDGKLYATTGDTADREEAQNLRTLQGKTLRLNDDGSVPKDNPFVDRKDARPEIWSYGHRNSQGIAWEPSNNQMWQTDHGPSGFDGPGGGDEVNRVTKAANYGWPVVSHSETHAGMEAPKVVWTPAKAPSGCAFYTGDKLPQFKGNLFVACLRGESLMRLTISGDRVTDQEALITGLGRIRAVADGTDGYLYFTTSNQDGRGDGRRGDDRIIRIVPSR